MMASDLLAELGCLENKCNLSLLFVCHDFSDIIDNPKALNMQ
jgi:hypothetical protein